MFHKKYRINIPEVYGNYVLFAICTHVGNANRGHYVTHIKYKDNWYLKDDDRVMIHNPPLNGYAYFCFFKLINS